MIRHLGQLGKVVLPLLMAAAALAGAGGARAEVTLPNGTVVPLDTSNGEQQLFTFFADQGQTLDWRTDAHDAPSTFSPMCDFQATLLLKEAGSDPGIGWYNADPSDNTPPGAGEIHTIVPSGTAIGSTVTGADIRNHADYAGGSVGFALLTNPPHFTEARYNTVCLWPACAADGPWTLALIYRSTTLPSAYYVAFEDGSTSSVSFGNDGDYNDDVFLLEGIACDGEGDACEVDGAQGVCKQGLAECDSSTGALVCLPVNGISDEICDGLDNDCDGESDEGDDLCEFGSICSRGVCAAICTGMEFPCAVEPFTQCQADVCIDPRCADVECGDGQTCVAGECRAPCDGVVCPGGQQCRVGVCVDPCAGVTCGEGRVCVGGACTLPCSCAGCSDAGTECDDTSGLCIETACKGVSCDAGSRCVAGSCVDACANALCPMGLACVAGQCDLPGEPGGGATGGDTGGSGTGTTSTTATTGFGSGGSGAGTAGRDAGPTPNGTVSGATDSGCGCSTQPQRSGTWLTPLLLALGLALRPRWRRSAAR